MMSATDTSSGHVAAGHGVHLGTETAAQSAPPAPSHADILSSSSSTSRPHIPSSETELLRMLDEDALHPESWFATPLRTLQQACMRVPQLSTVLSGAQRYRLYVRLLLDADPLGDRVAAEKDGTVAGVVVEHADENAVDTPSLAAEGNHSQISPHTNNGNANNDHKDDTSFTTLPDDFATAAVNATESHRHVAAILAQILQVQPSAPSSTTATDGAVPNKAISVDAAAAAAHQSNVGSSAKTTRTLSHTQLEGFVCHFATATSAQLDSRGFLSALLLLATVLREAQQPLFVSHSHQLLVVLYKLLAVVQKDFLATPMAAQYERTSIVLMRLLLQYHDPALSRHFDGSRIDIAPWLHRWFSALFCVVDADTQTPPHLHHADKDKTGAASSRADEPAAVEPDKARPHEDSQRQNHSAFSAAAAAAAATGVVVAAAEEHDHSERAETEMESSALVWSSEEREECVREALMVMDWVFILGDPVMLPYVALSYLITHRRHFLVITSNAELRRAIHRMRFVLTGRREQAVSPRLIGTYQQVSLGSVWSGKSLLQNAELIYRKTPLSAQRVLEFCQYPDRGTINYSAEAAEAYYGALPCLPLERIDFAISFAPMASTATMPTHATMSTASSANNMHNNHKDDHPGANTDEEHGAVTCQVAPSGADVRASFSAAAAASSEAESVQQGDHTTTDTTNKDDDTHRNAADCAESRQEHEARHEQQRQMQHAQSPPHAQSSALASDAVSSLCSIPALEYIILDCRSKASFDYARLPTAIFVGDVIGYDMAQLDDVLARVMSIQGANLVVFGTGRSLTEELNLLKMLALYLVGRHFPHVSLATGGFRSLIPLARSGAVRVESNARSNGRNSSVFHRADAAHGLFTLPAGVGETAAQTTQKITSALNNLTEYLPQAAAEGGDAVRQTAEQLRNKAKEGVSVASAWGLNVVHKMQEKFMDVRDQVKQRREAAEQQEQHNTHTLAGSRASSSSFSYNTEYQGRVVTDLVRGPVLQGIAKTPSSSALASQMTSPSSSSALTSLQQQQQQQQQHFFSLGEDTDDDDFGLITSIPPRPLKGASVGALIHDSDKSAASAVGGGNSVGAQPTAVISSGTHPTTQQHTDPRVHSTPLLRAPGSAAAGGDCVYGKENTKQGGGPAATEDFTAAIDAEFEELFGEEFTAKTDKTTN